MTFPSPTVYLKIMSESKYKHTKMREFLDKADPTSVAFARAYLVHQAEQLLKEANTDGVANQFAKDVIEHLGFDGKAGV